MKKCCDKYFVAMPSSYQKTEYPMSMSSNENSMISSILLSNNNEENKEELLKYITSSSTNNNNNMKWNLRGERVAQSEVLPISFQQNNNDTIPLSDNTITPSTAEQTTTSNPENGMLLTIICMLILAPCLMACVAQSIYWVKKKKQDRVDRQLEAVSTNPTSRMLVLSEIFKNDSRAVTEDEASPKKKRVLVKKHRKKTPSEHDDQAGKSIDEIIDMNIYSNDNNNSNDDEEIGRPRGNTHGTEIIDKHNSLSWTSDDDDEKGVSSTTNDDKRPTTILYISDNIENGQEDNNAEKEGVEEVEDNDVPTPHLDKEEKISEIVNNNMSEADVTNVNRDDNNTDESKVDVDKSEVGRNDSMVNDDGGENVEETEGEHHNCSDSLATSLSLAPKISSSQLTLNEDNINDRSRVGESNVPTDTTLEPNAALSPELLTIPSVTSVGSVKRYLSPRASPLPNFLHGSNTNSQASSPRLLNMPDLRDDEDDNSAHGEKAGAIHVVGMSSIFRENKEEAKDEEDIPEIHACGSSVTEVTSNVDGLLKPTGSSFDDILEPLPLEKAATNDLVCLPYKLDPIESLSRTSPSELRGSIPLNNVESYKSTDRSLSSNISYFSYEDVSVASEECEMCAICICPYEEGDIRIFSKRCPHVFHKECILEWLVKSHNECPCCRVDMVTKTEITMVSQSLIGTNRLAQAMAAVGSEMQQAPPFRVRGSQMARQMMNRARAQRRRSGEAAENTTSETPMSPNANWLWSARFANEGPPSTPRRSNSVSSSSNNVSSNDGFQQPRTINPSRSSDAIMNPHEIASAPVTPTTANGGGVSIHNHSTIHTSAGSLFSSNSSMVHDHWQQQSASRRARNQTAPITLSPNRAHSAWSRQRPRALTSPTRRRPHTNSSTEESLPVTVLPISPPSSRLHSNWQTEQN